MNAQNLDQDRWFEGSLQEQCYKKFVVSVVLRKIKVADDVCNNNNNKISDLKKLVRNSMVLDAP